jgi:hypothetical protein
MFVACLTSLFKRKKLEALASYIKRTGFEMFFCLSCEKRNLKYMVSNKENLSRCFKCVLCKVKCNIESILVSE